MKSSGALVLIFIPSLFFIFASLTIHDDQTFNNLNSGKNIEVFQGQKIQDAIDQASEGDTITVHNGIYYESIDINKSIYLRAANGGGVTITNEYKGLQKWTETSPGSQTWVMEDVNWPVHRLLVNGIHAFDYRNKERFKNKVCGPYWSKGWQSEKENYPNPPIYFARDSITETLWLHLQDNSNPNSMEIDFNSSEVDDTTLVQKDLGEYWNQQEIVTISKNPPIHPIDMWYAGTPQNPSKRRVINFPKICGITIDVNADSVTIEGFRIHMGPTVGVEVNNSKYVTIKDCYFSGFKFGINTGYECTNLTVKNCEFDGGELISFGNHDNVNLLMWDHSTYIIPVKFNGTGLTFHHNYIYEGYDLFQPRGRHKDYSHVPDLMSNVAYNVWQKAIDNNLEFDGVEATISMRFHHNLVLGRGSNDMLAITTTEHGNPLQIDHNLFWNGGDDSRIMKLTGTRRRNDGIQFFHNTYITGSKCSAAPFGPNNIFENNIVISKCNVRRCWNRQALNTFMPTRNNLCLNGDKYIANFKGLVTDPKLGNTDSTFFSLQPRSPAIDAGIYKEQYHHSHYSGDAPDLGALESSQDINDWRENFGHTGPTWIDSENASKKAPHRPAWPVEIDKRWGGLTDN